MLYEGGQGGTGSGPDDRLPLRGWDIPPKGWTNTQVVADDTLWAIIEV